MPAEATKPRKRTSAGTMRSRKVMVVVLARGVEGQKPTPAVATEAMKPRKRIRAGAKRSALRSIRERVISVVLGVLVEPRGSGAVRLDTV